MKDRISRGFTLFELLLVVALIGLIAAVASPGFSNTDVQQRAHAESFLRDVFKTARLSAMRFGLTCGVHVDASSSPQRIRYYRYNPSLAVADRMVFDPPVNPNDPVDPDLDFCRLHPASRKPLDQTFGNQSTFPRVTLTFNPFRGTSNGTTFRTGHLQFDAQGRPWVFNGLNEPVPLTDSDPATQSPVVYAIGDLTGDLSGGLVVCPFTGQVFLKSKHNDSSPCTTP